jgi:hypothetical protein
MKTESLLKALLDVWDDLPGLVGPQWAELYPRLEALLSRLLTTHDRSTQASLFAQVVLTFGPYPQARDRLKAAASEAAPRRGRLSGSTRRGSALEGFSDAETVDGIATLNDLMANLEKHIRQPRHVNICIAPAAEEVCLPKSTSLVVDRDYRLRLAIGTWSSDTIVANRTSFPTNLLPPTTAGHWLEVVAVSDECVLPHRRYHLFLPRTGSSWVCRCSPGGEHACTPDGRQPYLFVPLLTPHDPAMARVRIGVYYRNNLVQSILVTARIDQSEHHSEHQGDGQRAWVDYTLTATLSDFEALPSRTFSILTTDNGSGSHRVVVKDGSEEVLAFKLTEGQMSGAIDAVRTALHDVHIEESTNWLHGQRRINRYDETNAKPRDAFVADLKLLAPLGQTLWVRLLEDRSRAVWDRLGQPATIQVSRITSSFVFPWALVYDIPLEPGAAFAECRLLSEWHGARQAIGVTARRCPYEREHTLNTICPFGFWGFKHIIEQPPSMPEGRSLSLVVQAVNQPAHLVAGVSLDLPDHALSTDHLQRLAPVFTCASVTDLRQRLAEPVEMIYFYTHGRRHALPGGSQSTPALALGTSDLLLPETIAAWRRGSWPAEHWQRTSPLVFINGCHTVDITPESLVSFVESFANASAAGVIGTEIAIAQRVAGEVAEEFFRHFRAELTVGEALHRTRINLLLKGNLLGLAYTPYCSADLRLSSARS